MEEFKDTGLLTLFFFFLLPIQNESLVCCFAVYSCLYYRNVYHFSQLLQAITKDAILCSMSS